MALLPLRQSLYACLVRVQAARGTSQHQPQGGSQQPGGRGAGLVTDGLFSSLKLARFVEHHSPREVPAPSWGEHHGLGRTREVSVEGFSSRW